MFSNSNWLEFSHPVSIHVFSLLFLSEVTIIISDKLVKRYWFSSCNLFNHIASLWPIFTSNNIVQTIHDNIDQPIAHTLLLHSVAGVISSDIYVRYFPSNFFGQDFCSLTIRKHILTSNIKWFIIISILVLVESKYLYCHSRNVSSIYKTNFYVISVKVENILISFGLTK